MSFTERLFQSLALRSTKVKRAAHALDRLDRLGGGLGKFATMLRLEVEEIEVVPSLRFVGLQGPLLHLPAQSFDARLSEEDIEKVFLHLVMLIVESRNLGLASDEASWQSRQVEFGRELPRIRQSLNDRWPNFQEVDRFVQECCESLVSHRKAQVVMKDFGVLFLPSLELRRPTWKADDYEISTEKRASKKSTEKDKPHTGEVEMVNLHEQQVNPVLHSFEKMETIDEYKGGRKVDSGDDQLSQEGQALSEVDLAKMTRDGAAVDSFYMGPHFAWLTQAEDSRRAQFENMVFTYPEWSLPQQRYLKNHCQLKEISPETAEPSTVWIDEVFKKHRAKILKTRQLVQQLRSEPLWLRRLVEGPDLDLDNFTREWPDLKSRRPVEGRWYAEKRQLRRDVAVSILIDQSLSSDSWIGGYRVLDIILESVAMVGLIVEESLPLFEVFGTWTATRHHCHLVTHKASHETWAKFFHRAKSIEPCGYTRLGPALRHVTKRLESCTAKQKLMLVLTDGKPTDLDGYEGLYGAADVKKACLEAEKRGVWTYSLMIDQRAKQHFPKMFSHYSLLPRPDLLMDSLVQILLQLMKRA